MRADALIAGGWEPMAHNTTPEGVMPIGPLRPEHQPYVGRRLAEIAAMGGQHWVDAALDLLLAEGQRTSRSSTRRRSPTGRRSRAPTSSR